MNACTYVPVSMYHKSVWLWLLLSVFNDYMFIPLFTIKINWFEFQNETESILLKVLAYMLKKPGSMDI